MPDLVESVAALLRRTAADIVVPLFGSPRAGASEKGPGDWVTAADREAEVRLTAELPRLLPGSCVVGEEAVHADPGTMTRLHGDDPVWLVDPLDGTANFAAGREPFGMIVALVEQGITTLGWIYLPLEYRMVLTRRGGGTRIDPPAGQDATPQPDGRLRGMVPLWALPRETADALVRRSDGIAELLPSWRCAGREYPDVLTGAVDFALFTGSRPWDHAAGALALAEAGGVARYSDGTPYAPRISERLPLLVARTPAIWDRVRNELMPPDAFAHADGAGEDPAAE